MTTNNFKVENKRFCMYCGKEIHGEMVVSDDYYVSEEFECGCEYAQKEVQLRQQIKSAEGELRCLMGISYQEMEKIQLQEEIKIRQEKLDKMN